MGGALLDPGLERRYPRWRPSGARPGRIAGRRWRPAAAHGTRPPRTHRWRRPDSRKRICLRPDPMPKLLLLDIGNTNTHLGLAHGHHLYKQANIPTASWFDRSAGKRA